MLKNEIQKIKINNMKDCLDVVYLIFLQILFQFLAKRYPIWTLVQNHSLIHTFNPSIINLSLPKR